MESITRIEIPRSTSRDPPAPSSVEVYRQALSRFAARIIDSRSIDLVYHPWKNGMNWDNGEGVKKKWISKDPSNLRKMEMEERNNWIHHPCANFCELDQTHIWLLLYSLHSLYIVIWHIYDYSYIVYIVYILLYSIYMIILI